MTILERQIQKLTNCEWLEYSRFEKKNAEIESRLGGFPSKKHYGFISGNDTICMVVWQREWKNYASMSHTYEKYELDSKPELEGVNSPVANEWRFYISMD